MFSHSLLTSSKLKWSAQCRGKAVSKFVHTNQVVFVESYFHVSNQLSLVGDFGLGSTMCDVQGKQGGGVWCLGLGLEAGDCCTVRSNASWVTFIWGSPWTERDTTEKLPSHNFVGRGNNANLYTWFPASRNYKLPCVISLTVQISVFGAHDHSVSRFRGTIKSLARYFGMRNSSWWKVGLSSVG